jgi:iron complex transport system permease protein
MRRSAAIGCAVSAGLLAVMTLLSLGAGAVPVSPANAAGIVLAAVGVPQAVTWEPQQAGILLGIRLPRTVLGAGAGATLAMAGAVLQGVFRNPLADPALIGVSSGAALMAAAALTFGEPLLAAAPAGVRAVGLALAAFAGGLAATAVVLRVARAAGHTAVASMLLAGIAVNALAAALTGFLLFIASDAQLRSITFWTLGSLGGATWTALGGALPILAVALLGLPRLARGLNLFLLGEAEAGHLGVDVEGLKRRAVTLAALGVGAAVAVTGVIGFVGLVVPHLWRLLLGPDHRALLPGSACLGGALLLAADVVARTVAAPAELPIGVVTALAGGPFLLWLLAREPAVRELG